jgi:chromosome segregation ATPase
MLFKTATTSIDDQRQAAATMAARVDEQANTLRQQIAAHQARQALISEEIAAITDLARQRTTNISRLVANYSRAVAEQDEAQKLLNLAAKTSAEPNAAAEVEARQRAVQEALAAMEKAQQQDVAQRQDEGMRIAAWRDEQTALDGKVSAAQEQIADLEQQKRKISSNLGQAEYEHYLAQISALKARASEAECLLADRQRELDAAAHEAVNHLAQWPEHLATIRRLQRPSDALLTVFDQCLAYIGLLMREIEGLPATIHKEGSQFPISYRHLLSIPDVELRESGQMSTHRERLLEVREIWAAR